MKWQWFLILSFCWLTNLCIYWILWLKVVFVVVWSWVFSWIESLSWLSCLFISCIWFKIIGLINMIWLINILNFVLLICGKSSLVLTKIIFIFWILWLVSCQMFICYIFTLLKKRDIFAMIHCITLLIVEKNSVGNLLLYLLVVVLCLWLAVVAFAGKFCFINICEEIIFMVWK